MAMSVLAQTIDQLSREKGIDPSIIVSALEDAMVVAARKYYKTQEPMKSEFDPKTGHINIFAVRTIVQDVEDVEAEISVADALAIDPASQVGGQILIPKPTDVLGRIAAQTAKQVIMQKVREAEREVVFSEYKDRVGELIQCVVKGTDGPDVLVDLGRYEGCLSKREQSRIETYGIGDRLRVVIKEVDAGGKSAPVIVSRADAMLVQRLFEMEVPEIYDGTVSIRAIAREAGDRTKIAVLSNDRDVDAVGACVGMKGMRVQSIIRELRGEKIDIIEWHDDVVQFATNALSPAKVAKVSVLDVEERRLEVVVEDTQLSLAIGKKGQNVRLASKLLGWHIDIKSEEEKRQEIEAEMASLMGTESSTPLEQLAGLGDKTREKISASGIQTVEELASRTPEELMAIPGIGEKMVEKIAAVVREYFESPSPATGDADGAAGASPAEKAAEPGGSEPSVPESAEAASETVGEQPSAELNAEAQEQAADAEAEADEPVSETLEEKD